VIVNNGNVVYPDGTCRRASLSIENGIIGRIIPGKRSAEGKGETIDADGLLVVPGGIDPHVHFDDPGYTTREDFFHGTCAAASGGITTVIDMPDTSVPDVTSREGLEKKLDAVKRKAVVDFGFYGGVSAQAFESRFPRAMKELAPFVLGYKTYFISGMDTYGRLDHHRFLQVLKSARELGRPVLLHAEDYDYVEAATEAAFDEGSGPLQYYRSRPETAEVLAVLCAARLAREAAASLHIVHLSTSEAAGLLDGVLVTGETCPHYLQFSLDDFVERGASLKCTPPVKKDSKEGLWQGIADGSIGFIASDHAPCTEEEKNTGSIWTDYAGIPGSGTLLPYLFSEGYREGKISLGRFIEAVSAGAARRYGLYDRKGSIEEGKDADLVLIDPEETWTVRGKTFLSKGKITPFEGMEMRGRVKKTIVRGKVVYDDALGITAEKGYGRFLKPGK